jgi:adenylate cyclase
MKISPFSANMPGVEKNATVVANIMSENFVQSSPRFIDLLIVLLAGLLIIFLCNQLKALYAIIAFMVLTSFLIISNQVLFTSYGIRMMLAYPLFTVLSSGMFIISFRYFGEEKKARDIRRMFSSYVTERVVDELIKNPELARLGGYRREVTVLFSDIRGFTSFSENQAPEDVVATLNEYLEAMTEVIFKWEGTLDKFIGDAIVAFRGAPLEQDNHAERAVRCALHMIRRLQELQKKWESEGKSRLDIGIGINTGEVLVGNIGAEGKKMDYTVIGDHVNLGARIESLTRKYDTHILMTEFTLQRISGLIQSQTLYRTSVRGLEKVVVKGKEKPVEIYEVSSFEGDAQSTIEEIAEKSVVKFDEK